ncbi:MAG: T9SS type A sorting domain-containing protein [Bacteroidota bacterium]
MKGKFLLTATLVSLSLCSAAQTARTYAITGKSNNNFLWADIKQIDIATGKVVKTLFESDKTPFTVKSLDNSADKVQVPNPTSFGVAACALDERHGRLYFAPMHFSDIRYLDLNKTDVNFTVVKKNIIPVNAGSVYQPEENQITRMVIAADGYGYALTNDANHLIRFTTGKKPVVEDLGALVDAEENKGFSIHNKCTSWGGDMLADAFGRLVVISANHNVYTVDVKTKTATFTGTITGLPANYTTNGAVVDNDGNMIVISANVFEGLYRVNFKDLKAVKVESTEKAFNASDLANSNMLLQNEKDASVKFDVTKSVLPDFAAASDAQVFPNPATGEQFNVRFNGQKAGRYTIIFSDLAGKPLYSKVVTITGKDQIQNVRLTSKTARGTYLIKVVDENKQLAFTERVVLQ